MPINLDRIWGSVFSFSEGKFFGAWPKILPYPVTISVGMSMPAASKSPEIREKIMELGAEAFEYRLADKMTLSESFFNETRNWPLRFCIADSSGKKLNRIMALVISVALSRRLAKIIVVLKRLNRELIVKIGILLPPSVAGALTNIAVDICGSIPVNINYTASKEAIASIIEQCDMKTIITSRTFLEKSGVRVDCECIYVEDVIKSLKVLDYAGAIISIFAFPRIVGHKLIFGTWRNRDNQNLATIMFTSGSTGTPKGVMLTHANITSHLEGLYQLLKVTDEDKMLGILPFFHSFGFTGTLWFPLISGMGAIYHYNPLDARMVGKLIGEHKATLLMATPTFLGTYTRRCEPEQMKSLRLVVVGAEKLKAPIAQEFQEKFGVLPMEGYGCTELSPVVCVNLPDFEFQGIVQKANKPGTIGLPLPGIALKIVDPDTFEAKSFGEQGLLLVKGPNVMKGYLNQFEKTQEIIIDGWYKTGDIAFMDEDGFVTITDRLSRFSKIAGEMVPHIKIEEAIHQILNATEAVCVVTSVPDDKKGEALVVLCLRDIDIPSLAEELRKTGLPNLWIPSTDMFFKIDALPMLGTGKLDLAAIKSRALRLVKEE